MPAPRLRRGWYHTTIVCGSQEKKKGTPGPSMVGDKKNLTSGASHATMSLTVGKYLLIEQKDGVGWKVQK